MSSISLICRGLVCFSLLIAARSALAADPPYPPYPPAVEHALSIAIEADDPRAVAAIVGANPQYAAQIVAVAVTAHPNEAAAIAHYASEAAPQATPQIAEAAAIARPQPVPVVPAQPTSGNPPLKTKAKPQ